MKYFIAVCGILATLAIAAGAGANQEIIAPCTINHDNWGPFSVTQWEHRSCPVSLPTLAPYSVIEVTIAPIIQIAPIGHPEWQAGCLYATPTWVNAPAGLAVTTTTNGVTIRAMVINLRDTGSEAGTVTIGVRCQ